MGIGIILLAAGSSSRLGQSKQLLLYKGETLLINAAKAAIQSGADYCVAVLGANDSKHKENISALDMPTIYNSQWQEGIGSSIKAGLSYLQSRQNENLEAAVVMVCDQVYITAAHLQLLIETYKKNKNSIVASSYNDTYGVPAVFDSKYFQDIKELKGEEGAKKIISQFKKVVNFVDFPGGAIDIDTLGDYEKIVNI